VVTRPLILVATPRGFAPAEFAREAIDV